jgi:hypothetical protein
MQPELIPDCWKVVAENCFVVDLLTLSAVSRDMRKYTSGIIGRRHFQFKELQKRTITGINQHGIKNENWWEAWIHSVTKYNVLYTAHSITQWCNSYCTDKEQVFFYTSLLEAKMYITDEEYYFRQWGKVLNVDQ